MLSAAHFLLDYPPKSPSLTLPTIPSKSLPKQHGRFHKLGLQFSCFKKKTLWGSKTFLLILANNELAWQLFLLTQSPHARCYLHLSSLSLAAARRSVSRPVHYNSYLFIFPFLGIYPHPLDPRLTFHFIATFYWFTSYLASDCWADLGWKRKLFIIPCSWSASFGLTRQFKLGEESVSRSWCVLFGPAAAFHCAGSAQRGPTKAHRRRAVDVVWLFKDFQHSKAFQEEKRVIVQRKMFNHFSKKTWSGWRRAANNRGQICQRRK